MLHDTTELRSLKVLASDGEIGKVYDVYFSDDTWTVRYVVVETGGWLTGRKVLVSPHAVRRIDIDGGEIALELTREQVKGSPDFDSDKPVSRQYETEYSEYYGYPFYWVGPYAWGAAAYPLPAGRPGEEPRAGAVDERLERAEHERARSDPHLRSVREVTGYKLEAIDGGIGHIETFLFDETAWSIAAIVVDTRNWWPGKHVVISPSWIEEINWDSQSARLSVTRERVKARSEYDPQSASGSERDTRAERIRHALHFGD